MHEERTNASAPDVQELGSRLSHGTRDVFSTMLGVELTAEGIRESCTPPLSAEVTALLGIGGALQGTVFVHCSRDQAQIFTARLLGSETPESHTEVEILDAVGEIANMVAGNLKRSFPQPAPFELSVPTVAQPPTRIRVKARRSVVVQLGSPYGSFHAEVVLEARRP